MTFGAMYFLQSISRTMYTKASRLDAVSRNGMFLRAWVSLLEVTQALDGLIERCIKPKSSAYMS